jgi:hypothetical protein
MADRKPPWLKVLGWAAGLVVATPVILVVAVVLWSWFAGDLLEAGPRSISCAEALDTAGLESLPVDQAAAECTAGGFTDSFVTIDFTSTQAATESWFAAELPDVEPDTICTQADVCIRLEPGDPGAPPSDGWYLAVDLTEQGEGDVTVSVNAHTM